LQDNIQKSEDDVIENEVLQTSCENSEPSPITPAENESQGNANDGKLIGGESSLDVLNFSTNHAKIEQHLLNTKTELSLSQNNCSNNAYAKEELCDNTFIMPMSQLVDVHDAFILQPNTCAQNKHLLPIANEKDQLKLLSSLNTLGYIEFDTL